MSNMDDLRSIVDDDDKQEFSFDDLGMEIAADGERAEAKDPKFLGLTAGERAFLSVVLFLNVLVIGVGLLVVTGRIVF